MFTNQPLLGHLLAPTFCAPNRSYYNCYQPLTSNGTYRIKSSSKLKKHANFRPPYIISVPKRSAISANSALQVPERTRCKLSFVCLTPPLIATLLTADSIEKGSNEVIKESEEPIDNVEELIEELPDNNPRYVVLSYPMKLSDGRVKSPFVLLYWRPPTTEQESKMLYAGAVELFREKAGVAKYVLTKRGLEKILTTDSLRLRRKRTLKTLRRSWSRYLLYYWSSNKISLFKTPVIDLIRTNCMSK